MGDPFASKPDMLFPVALNGQIVNDFSEFVRLNSEIIFIEGKFEDELKKWIGKESVGEWNALKLLLICYAKEFLKI